MSTRSVLAALDPRRYEVTQIGISRSGSWHTGENVLQAFETDSSEGLTPVTMFPEPSYPGLRRIDPTDQGTWVELFRELDIFFPVLHGTFGEDGALQGVFEMAGAAYVGCGVLGSAVGMDKGVFKDVMRANGVPVLEATIIRRSDLEQDLEGALEAAEKVAPYPLFTKPANLGSSVGVSKCHHRSDLIEGLMDAATYDRRILVERGINGREIEVSVLGNDSPSASIPGEIIPGGEFYTYVAKYHDDRSELLIPAPISDDLVEVVQTYAVKAFKAIDGAGLARVDFLLDRDDGGLYLNELNTMPGFTKISMYPKLWEASGMPYATLIDKLIALGLERHKDRLQTKFLFERGT
jgi:D-alanine-D-alanine ligase